MKMQTHERFIAFIRIVTAFFSKTEETVNKIVVTSLPEGGGYNAYVYIDICNEEVLATTKIIKQVVERMDSRLQVRIPKRVSLKPVESIPKKQRFFYIALVYEDERVRLN